MSTYTKRLFLITITLFSTIFGVSNAHAFSIINKVTHNISAPSSGDIFSNMSVSWSPKPEYSGLSFSYHKLAVKRPNGTKYYKNISGSSYSFKPSTAGSWCFAVRAVNNGDMGLYTGWSCTSVSDSISGKVTHSVSAPSSGDIFSNINVSWSARSGFSGLNYSYYKVAIKEPGASSNYYRNVSSRNFSIQPDKPGSWCFTVRAVHNGIMGLYDSWSCTNVSDSISGHYTHTISAPSQANLGEDITFTFAPKSTYSSLNYDYLKLAIKEPDEEKSHSNTNGSSYTVKADKTGDWCFAVRGIYKGVFGLYTSYACTTVVSSSTHDILVPASASLYDGVDLSWSAKPSYQNQVFDAYQLTIRDPNNNTTTTQYSSLNAQFSPDSAGNWCFAISASQSGQWKPLSDERCTQVSDSIVNRVTHNISVTPSVPSDGTYQVAWTPIDKYKDVAFTHVKLAIKDPDPTVDNIHDNYQPTQTYTFTPTKGGEWCFTVRGSYNGELGLYNDYQCINVPDIDSLSAFSVPSRVAPGEQITISWGRPSNTDVAYYQVYGELKGKIAQVSKDTDHIVRAAGTEGREYCYKARAVFANNSEGPFSDTKCTLVSSTNSPVFPEISGIGLTKISEQSFNLSWQGMSGAHRYLVELQTAESISDLNGNRWQPIGYTASAQLPMSFSAFHQAIYNSMARFTFRVSACNSDGVCGNYGRLAVKTLTSADFLTVVPAEHKVPACIYVPESTAENSPINIQFCPAQSAGVTSYNLYGELAGVIQSGTLSSFTSNAQGLSTAQRPSLPAGKEYCYKVEAMYGVAKGGYSEKLCTVIGELLFNATAEFIALPSDEIFNQFSLLWAPIAGAESYLLEREVSFGVWEAHTCDIAVTEYNGQTYQSCIVETSNEQLIPEKGKVVYRVSACNAQGQCGNYERVNFEPMAMPPVNSPENKLRFGDFETGNAFEAASGSVAAIAYNVSNPLFGLRSLQVTLSDSNTLQYAHQFNGEVVKASSIDLFGYIKLISQTGNSDLTVSIITKYADSEMEFDVTQTLSSNDAEKQLISISLPLDPTKVLSELRVTINRNCSNCSAQFLMDNFFLGFQSNSLKVFSDKSGNLYFKGLPDSEGNLEYFKLARVNGTWQYVKLTQEQYESLTDLKEEDLFSVALEDINGDGLTDVTVFSNNGAVRVQLLNSNTGFSLEKVKQTLFIHTDLLGSPVAETDFEGGVQ